jgi:plastocyanin
MRARLAAASSVLALLATAMVWSPGVAASSSAMVTMIAASSCGTISGFCFSPAAISIPIGGSVQWLNGTSVPHSATSDAGGSTATPTPTTNGTGWSTPVLGSASSPYTITFTAPGTFAYHCSVHPDMKGMVIVSPPTTFYFAEGYTGTGFSETLSLLMPNHTGTAAIDYYLEGGVHQTGSADLTAGKVTVVDVNAAVGANHQVSAKVTLPGPGVAERTIHFNIPGQWHGSTDIVGVARPNTEWDFAEGSTLTSGVGGPLIFSEYLTLQNPNVSAVPVSLNYFTDSGLTPVKGLTLAANSRTTVEVFRGDTSSVNPCVPNGAGASCGVGPGIGGVSVQVISATFPIIAERPLYVDSHDFGDGAISDGHDAFGAAAAGSTWNFAEGTTLGGFKEYLTLQNPGPTAATVNLNYFTNSGAHPVKTLTVNAHSRVTVEVFNGDATTNQGSCVPNGAGANCGVGPNIGGVSIQVTSTQPIVTERPMYMVHDFGTGPVAGAHVVVGATTLGTLFGFAAGSTLAGENDFLTIQNPGSTTAQVTITYYANVGSVQKGFNVNPNSRVTVEVFRGGLTANPACSPGAGTCGVGAGVSPLGIVLQASQPVLVEKPTYNSTTDAYGATDTLGYSPTNF